MVKIGEFIIYVRKSMLVLSVKAWMEGDESKIDLIQGHKTAENGTSKAYREFWEILKQLTPNTSTFRTMVDTIDRYSKLFKLSYRPDLYDEP